jgi:hypothetical protein
MSELKSAESTFSMAYRLRLDGEYDRIYWLSITTLRQISEIWREAPRDSVLLVPLVPRGYGVALVRGLNQDPHFVQERTGLPMREAHLLATIAPLLTRMVLTEDILARAVKWQQDAEYDKWLGVK